MNKQYVISFIFGMTSFLGFSFNAQAQHKGISFQAVIKKSNGIYPNASGVKITAQILDPVHNCILREEVHAGKNISNGYLTLVLGDSSASTPAGYNPSPVLSISEVMDNKTIRDNLTCVDPANHIVATGKTYVPSDVDRRILRLRMTLNGEDIAADFNMRSVAFAVNSEMLNSKSDTDFINVNDIKGVNQANLESIFERFTKLDGILNGFNADGNTLSSDVSVPATSVSGTVAVSSGGTGGTTASEARTNLGLGPLATMNPGGSADSNNYLRGDGTWAAAPQSTTDFSGTLSGDVSGTQASTKVERLQGRSLTNGAPADGQAILWDSGGSVWKPQYVRMQDIRNSWGGAQMIPSSSCGAGQAMVWSTVTDRFTCQNVVVPVAQVTGLGALATKSNIDLSGSEASGVIADARLPASAKYWTAATGGVSYSAGSVGIGTSTPGAKLDVNGSVNVNGRITGVAAPSAASDAATKAYVDAAIAGSFSGYTEIVSSLNVAASHAGNLLFTRASTMVTVNLPASASVADGFTVSLARQNVGQIKILTQGADLIRGKNIFNTNGIETLTLTKSGSGWNITNVAQIPDGCSMGIVGGACDNGSTLFAGIMNGNRMMTTPGGCTDSPNPVCAGGDDTVMKIWGAYNIDTGSYFHKSGSTIGPILAATYADTAAAKYCEDMNYAGYSDWFLPSGRELNLLSKGSFSGIAAGYYYNSNEYSTTSTTVIQLSSGNGQAALKTASYYVRCMRIF